MLPLVRRIEWSINPGTGTSYAGRKVVENMSKRESPCNLTSEDPAQAFIQGDHHGTDDSIFVQCISLKKCTECFTDLRDKGLRSLLLNSAIPS